MGVQPKTLTIEGPLHRRVLVRADMLNEEDRTIELSFSSDQPVERYFGSEILLHGEENVRLTRIRESGPLLFNHDPDRHIGRIKSVRVEGGKGVATVQFSNSALGREKLQDVKDGILREVSVGYVIHKATREETDAGSEVYRATDWEPLEISMVTIPADTSVGVGRSSSSRFQVEVTDTRNHQLNTIMSEENKPAPGTIDLAAEREKIRTEERAAASRQERERLGEIRKAAEDVTRRGFSIPEGAEEKAVSEGWNRSQFELHCFKNQPEKSPKAPADVDLGSMEREANRGKAFSIIRALASQLRGRKLDGFEGEVVSEIEKRSGQSANGVYIPADALGYGIGRRDLLAGDYDAGGSLVPTQLQPGIIPVLRNRPAAERLGVQMLTGLSGNVSIGRQTSAGSVSWVGEAESTTESTQGTDLVIMTPHGVSGGTDVSKQFLLQSAVDGEAFVRNDLRQVLNLATDKAVLLGTGVDGQPKGLFYLDTSNSGINTLSYGGAPTFADVVEHESLISADNADAENMRFALTPAVVGKWKTTTKDTGSGLFLIDGDMRANGYEVVRTNQIAAPFANYSAFGDWSQCIFGMFGAIDVTVDQLTGARSGLVKITLLAHVDVAFRHPEAFTVSTDSAAQS